jgi:ribosomal protein L12E/L44/L45/RPP1/RPP2
MVNGISGGIMRGFIGWTLALLASSLLGAALYQTVLTNPLPPPDPNAVLERVSSDALAAPVITRTQVRTVVDPAPTVTVVDVVTVVAPAPQRAAAAPARTAAPASESRTARVKDDSKDDSDEQGEEQGDEHPEDSADD